MKITVKVEEAHSNDPITDEPRTADLNFYLEPQGYDDDAVVGLEVDGKTWIVRREDLARIVNTF